MPDRGDVSMRGVASLVRELAEGSARLVRQEVRLARLEMGAMVSGVGKGTIQVAAGVVFAVLGSLSMFTGIVLLPGDQWLRDQYWLAALVVTALAGGLAFWFARKGLRMLSPQQLVPDQTVAQLKEDTEWLKQRLTSAGTSN